MVGYQVGWQDACQIKKVLYRFSITYRIGNQAGQILFFFPNISSKKSALVREIFSLYSSSLR
ncbi:hypothetical protein [Brevibacillus daliensis]|uniref:hypothetical protein n=1 Tax=Brevibacillus daliensis TaxID=2892995 RepID=UPI001E5C5BB2|nr:hypothetical protein [Brevibacillus daliensis]